MKTARPILLAFVLCLFPLSIPAQQWRGEGTGYIVNSKNIQLNQGALELDRKGTPFARIEFEENSGKWNRSARKNYNQRLDFIYGKANGQASLKVIGKTPMQGKDTAWQIETVRIPCQVSAPLFAVDIAVRSNLPIQDSDGVGYRNALTWYDRGGRPLAHLYLKLETAAEKGVTITRTVGMVPFGAASFAITLGFDKPNLASGEYCEFLGITLSAISNQSEVAPEGEFELMPCFMETPEVSWIAEAPTGTAVKLQIATAEDSQGAPGAWSNWRGPDGTAQSYYTAPFSVPSKWCKCRVVLQGSGSRQPVLREFSISGFRQTNWEFFGNKYAPLIENLSASPTRNRREPIVLRMTGDSPIRWNSFQAQLDKQDATALFSRKGNLLTAVPPKDLTDGLHRIDLVIENIHGKQTRSTKYLLIGESPKGVHRTALRDDGVLLIDDKPVFPVGVYSVWKREFNNNDFDKAFKDLSKAGFNFAQSYKTGSDYMTFLNTAKKYGMYVWSPNFHANLRDERLQQCISHPAIAAWYIGDDTSDNSTPSVLQDRKDALRAIDNCRISVQADHVTAARQVSDYRHYVRSADGFLPEIYPIHDTSLEDRTKSVAEVIRDMRTIMRDIDQCEVQHPKCVWALLQYFQGWGGWNRFPEPAEIRAMIYGAIIHGATGITFYTYGGYQDKQTKNYGITSTPERWQAITTVTRQLHELKDILVERTPKTQPRVQILSQTTTDALGQPAITCLLKHHDGKSYLFAVNATLTPIKASFDVGNAKRAKVLFEGRKVNVVQGKIVDEFGPYAVHIYQFSTVK